MNSDMDHFETQFLKKDNELGQIVSDGNRVGVKSLIIILLCSCIACLILVNHPAVELGLIWLEISAPVNRNEMRISYKLKTNL